MNHLLTPAALIAALVAFASPAGAQPTLGDALRRADHAAYGNRIAAGNTEEQRARALLAARGILPTLRFEAGYLRTTDPVAVFGTKIRQGTISPDDFAPQQLVNPEARANYQGAIVLEQPIFNADAWTGRRAALRGADASRASQEWTRLSLRADVVRAFYGAVFAAERAATLRISALTARAHVAQAEALVRQGMVTKSDALLASVRAGEVDAQLAEAVGDSAMSRRRLAVLLGNFGADQREQDESVPGVLPTAAMIRAITARDTAFAEPDHRADVVAAAAALGAARSDVLRARSAYLPRVNGFARYDRNSRARLFTGEANWTVGVLASWSPFSGAGELAEHRAAAARLASAKARAEAAEASAGLDVEATRTALAVSLIRLAIAERAVTQSAEARRIVSRRYAEGLATVVELLDAQTAETQSALSLAQARYAAIAAAAARRQALGRDPGTLAEFDFVSAPADPSPPLPTAPEARRGEPTPKRTSQ